MATGETMDLERVFSQILKIDRQIDRIIEIAFISVAAVFGAWLAWKMLSVADASLLMKVIGAFVGAVISAVAMWLFWLVAKFFA